MLVARRALGNAKWVFPSSSAAGRIMDAKFPLRQVAAMTGIEVSAHDLRRTLSPCQSCHISPMALKALVNHSLGDDVTISGYVQMTVERLREPAQRVAVR